MAQYANNREHAEHIFGYHAGTETTIPVHETARNEFVGFAEALANELERAGADPRDVAMFWTKMQEASMAFHAALAFTAPLVT